MSETYLNSGTGAYEKDEPELYLDSSTGITHEKAPGPDGEIDVLVRQLGGTPEDAAAIKAGQEPSNAFKSINLTTTPGHKAYAEQLVDAIKRKRIREEMLAAGAQPGIATSPDDKVTAIMGDKIEPQESMLQGRQFQQQPDEEPQGPFMAGVKDELYSIGSGIMKGYSKLVEAIGSVEGAQGFLNQIATQPGPIGAAGRAFGIDSEGLQNELEISNTMQAGQYNQATQEHPLKGGGGRIVGGIVGFPYGGGSGTLPAIKYGTSAIANALSSGLSAAGRDDDVASEATFGALVGTAFEKAQSAGKAWWQGRKADRLMVDEANQDVINQAATEVPRAQESMRETGVQTVLPAQQTMDPWMLQKQSFIGEFSEVSRKAYNVLKQQNKEVADAVIRLWDKIAPGSDVGPSAKRAQEAAALAIKEAKDNRFNLANPTFQQAFKDGAKVNLAPVYNIIARQLKGLPEEAGKVKRAVLKAQAFLKPIEKEITQPDGTKATVRVPPTLEQLHGAKMEIDEMLDTFNREGGIGPRTQSYLMEIKESLLQQMEGASPGYKAGMDIWRTNSPAVNELRDGVIGAIDKLDPTQLKRVSSMLFDAAETNPEVTRKAIEVMRGAPDGDKIVMALLRTELEKRAGRLRMGPEAVSQFGGRSLENSPNNFMKAIFGNDNQRRLLYTALDSYNPEAARNARFVEDILERTAAGRPGGSQTAIRSEIKERIKKTVFSIREWFRQPLESAIGVGEQASMSHKVRVIGESMYNPEWAPDMARIRRMKAGSRAQQAAYVRLLDDIAATIDFMGTVNQAGAAGTRSYMRQEDE